MIIHTSNRIYYQKRERAVTALAYFDPFEQGKREVSIALYRKYLYRFAANNKLYDTIEQEQD